MAFRVEQTAQADRDLDAILDWLLSQQAGKTALRWFDGLQQAMESLSELAERCPLAPENSHFPYQVRQLVYGRKPHFYRVGCAIEGDAVLILHVRHGRRLPIAAN